MKKPFLPEASFGLRVLSLPASVCVCVCVCGNHEFVRVITHHPFKLGSPNLNQRYKTTWLRSLLFYGTIDLDLQGQIKLQSQNLPHFELVHAITHHQLMLQFPNLEQKCILTLFRSLPVFEIDFQFNFWFQTQTKLSFLCTSLAFFSETSEFESWEPCMNSEGVNQFKEQPLEQLLGIDFHSVNVSWWDHIEYATGRRPFGLGVVMALGV